MRGRNLDDINADLQYKSIVTRYGNNKKTYQIERIDFQRTPTSTFILKDREITFDTYFLEKYGLSIKDKNQPVVVIKSRRTGQETVLIPELCYMTGLTDDMRANFNLMKDVNNVLQKPADARFKEIKRFVEDLAA